MKTTLKKVLSMALALVLLVGVLPFHALAEETAANHASTFESEDGGNIHIGTSSPCTNHTSADGAWSQGPDSHWKVCGTCGQPFDEDNHDASLVNGTTSHWMACSVCEYTYDSEAHDWAAATCKTAKTCKDCGYSEGGVDSTKHNPNIEAATCKDAKICKDCGVTLEEKQEHDWNAATCTAPKTCSSCGATEGTATGHAWSVTAPKTCCICGTPYDSVAKFTVSYNVNVNASRENIPLDTKFTAGSTMGDALDILNSKTITRPGLYPTWFKLAGWYWDRACTNPVTRNTLITEDTVVYAKWERKYNYEVTLKLYTNGNTNTVVKVVDAFAYIQDDGILSNSEVTAIAKQYIESNNNAPITAYGPFKSGSEWDNYCKYQNRLSTQNQYIAEDDPATVLHVMVHNAKIGNSTSSTGKKADSSNPKTGDMILMPAAIMGTSVTALAVMFYLKKKRTV